MRIGIGYDIHRLVKGRKLILGGIEIPARTGLYGHSDADVISHAVMDALLGAAGLRDIGYHFPTGDQKYKDISSLKLLTEVNSLLASNGYAIGNIDVTIVAEEPKLYPFVDAMREKLSGALNITMQQIMIKASTNEGLDAAGRRKGIFAFAAASNILLLSGSLMFGGAEGQKLKADIGRD